MTWSCPSALLGFFAAFLLIPLKKLLLGKLSVEQCRAAADAPWHWRVRKHLLVDALPSHPVISMGAYLWSGTEVYNIWLRGMGMTVGRQAWIGENFQVDYPDLVNIRDRVSICRCVFESWNCSWAVWFAFKEIVESVGSLYKTANTLHCCYIPTPDMG